MYKYDATTKIASITLADQSVKQFTFDNADQVEALWLAAQKNVEKFCAFASISNKLDKVAKVTEQSAAQAELQAEVAKRASALVAKYAAFLQSFNTTMASKKTEYGVDNWLPKRGADDDTPRFTGASKAPKLTALLNAFGEDVTINSFSPDDGKTVLWKVYADDPEAWKAYAPGKSLNVELVGIANKANTDLGGKIKEVACHFGTDDKGNAVIVWKSQSNGTGGSTAGRVIAKGYKIGDKTYTKAEDACKALGITPKSHAPDGTPYWAAALKPAIDAGKCVKVVA